MTSIRPPLDEFRRRGPRQGRLVDEEGCAIERFIPHKVIGTAAILFAAALRNDIDDSAAIVAVLCRVVIAQHLDLADRVLVDGHADLIRAAGFARVESVNRRHG